MQPERWGSIAGAEVEAQKSEAFTSLKVDYAALFIIDFNLQLAELLPKSFVHCPNQPVMSLIGVDQDHQIGIHRPHSICLLCDQSLAAAPVQHCVDTLL